MFRTAYACGRFSMIATINEVRFIRETGKPDLNTHFTGQRNSKKPQTRQALLDRWGGKEAKRKGGDLNGISNHIWDALAVAQHTKETMTEDEQW